MPRAYKLFLDYFKLVSLTPNFSNEPQFIKGPERFVPYWTEQDSDDMGGNEDCIEGATEIGETRTADI
jgi:hypothetical protein